MTMGFLGEPTHWILILVLLLVLFGAKRLPELGKGLGEGLKGFKEGLKGLGETSASAPTVQQTQVPVQPAVSTPIQPAPQSDDMSYIVCTRCGGRFENPHGFKVADFVCRNCQARS
jgi:sec-independent protein translocase protein TatA